MAEAADRGMRAIILRAELLRRRAWIVVRPRARQGDRHRPADLSGPLDLVHEVGLSAYDFANAGTARGRARAPCGRSRSLFSRPRRHRPRVHHRHPRTGGRQASSQAYDLVAHPYVTAAFVPLCRELSEIAYLWNEPHRIDGGKLAAAIPATFPARRLTSRSRAPYGPRRNCLEEAPLFACKRKPFDDRRFPAPLRRTR